MDKYDILMALICSFTAWIGVELAYLRQNFFRFLKENKK